MSGSLEEAYVAVERAYGQGDFATALQLAEALQPQIPAGRPDLLDQRLDLLLGHIHLYGLNQPTRAATAYAAVLERCAEPSYRELASQGLELSRQQLSVAPVAEPEPISAPQAAESAVSPVSPVAQPIDQLPATPWLSQLQDPQQALEQIQAAWATNPPPQPAAVAAATTGTTPEDSTAETPWQPEPSAESEPQPEPIPAVTSLEDGESSLALQPLDPSSDPDADDGDQSAASDPEAIIPVVVTVEDDTPATDAPDSEEQVVATQEPAASRFSEEEWEDLSRGLLLVTLSSPQGD